MRSPGSRMPRAAACLGSDRATESPLRDNGYTRTINFNTHTCSLCSLMKYTAKGINASNMLVKLKQSMQIPSHYNKASLSGQDPVSDIFDKIHLFVQMDSWHDDTYPKKIWSSFVQPKWIYLAVHKPRMSVGQESCRARTSYVPRILQQHA